MRENNNSRLVPLHYSTICKWELRNKDRRVSKTVMNIFYKLKKVQIKQIKDKVSLALRKCKVKDKKLTVGDVLSGNVVQGLIQHNEGYKVLRTLRGSPPYWERAKKDVFSMIRQLGIPTWFCSFSSAETKWKPLLRTLGQLVDGKIYSDEDILDMSWNEKCRFIRSDPVTCTRFFDHKFQTFLKKVLYNELNPIGKVIDYFYRVEFQQRGSPHFHMLIWVENSPSLLSSNEDEVASFIDQYVTCHDNKEMSEYVNNQTHRHASTCRKKGELICRFGFPIPPMDKTRLLNGLEKDSPHFIKASKDYLKIMEVIESFKLGTNAALSFEEFLDKLNLCMDDYILALRSRIPPDKIKIFLKRGITEIRVNNYNEILMKCWEANMDIQYIIDPYLVLPMLSRICQKDKGECQFYCSKLAKQHKIMGVIYNNK